MTLRCHRVGRYDYSIDAGLGAPGRVRLRARNGEALAELGFVADDAPIPVPRIAPDLSHAAAFLHVGVLPMLLDMLRHETAAFVTFDNRPPGYVLVHTRNKAARAQPVAIRTRRAGRRE